jgi:hypothetical protein
MPRLYVDTSALLCVLLGEAGHVRLGQQLQGARLFSSTLLVLEAQRNLIHCGRTGRLPPTEVHAYLARLKLHTERFELRDVTLDLCLDPAIPAVTTPRSLDLVHLRTAMWFHRQQPLAAYVTLDEVQQRAARELGLPA